MKTATTTYTSIHLESSVADALLRRMDVTRDAKGRYVFPNGWTFWMKDEALTVALERLAAGV